MVYSAMNRPQNIQAQIPGRLMEWRVQEGQSVRSGDVVARLEDIDSKYLDQEQMRRVEAQRTALQEQGVRAGERIKRLEEQYASLNRSREAAISAAQQRVEQARQRKKATEQSLIATQQGEKIAREVARSTAGERVQQAEDRVRAAEQAVQAAKQNLETSRLNRERVRELFAEGLRSRRDDELAENDLVKNQTEVKRTELALGITQRDAKVGVLDTNRAGIEIERARTEIERARAALDIAERDITNSLLDLNRVMADTAASLNGISASQESAGESLAKIDAERSKLDIEQQNLRRRVEQQVIRAPRNGRIVRLLQVGEGATVKAGDTLAVMSPDSTDRAVELMVTDNDVPLLDVGRPVRLQFAGWPAKVPGFPLGICWNLRGAYRRD